MMVLLLGLRFPIAIFLLGIPKDHCADIIGGKESVPHSKPFMAKIEGNKLCGGSLIKSNWVLTAAHCEMTKNTNVILGAHSEKDKNTRQVFKVFRSVPHPDYNNTTKQNDIMLLQLNRSAKMNKYVAIGKLPKKADDLKAGTQCLVAGWGITENKKQSDVLREVNVSVIERSICNDKQHYNLNPRVTLNMVCAGNKNGGKDSCAGDSGGPLICKGIQSGIVSFGGKTCGDPHKPGVYTLLTCDYIDWINKITKGNL